ncbi:hypothetical protein GL218_06307 [Daldinia childiae]|uniref:uncharacterized protein n=1 Tax=Daldinia childiae TaxID=326645 RepID=UPI0014478B12|nr:uncharacterized protein GL218_06307 [Daldinia childiae]KAF3057470.1 hypothetical protein GL218_06307 [Daldinia childiae]
MVFSNLTQWNGLAGIMERIDPVARRSPCTWDVREELKKFLPERDAEETGVSYVTTNIPVAAARQWEEIEDRINAKHFGFKPPPPPRPRQLRHSLPSKRSRLDENSGEGTSSADNSLVARDRVKEPPRRLLKTEYGTFKLFDSGFWVLKDVGPNYKLKLPLAAGLREELEPIDDYEEELYYFEDDDAYQFLDTLEESDSEGSQPEGEQQMTECLASMDLMDINTDPPGVGKEVGDKVKIIIDEDFDASTDVDDHEATIKGKGKQIDVMVIDDDSLEEDYASSQNVLQNFGASPSNAHPFNVDPEGAAVRDNQLRDNQLRDNQLRDNQLRNNQRLDFVHLPEHNNSQIARQAANMDNNPSSQGVRKALTMDDYVQSLNPQNPTQADRIKYQKFVGLYPHLFRDNRTQLLPNGYFPWNRILRFDKQQIGVVQFLPDSFPAIPGYDREATMTYILSGTHSRTRLEPWPFIWRILIKFDNETVGAIEIRRILMRFPPPANPDGSLTDLLKIHSPLTSSDAPPVDTPNAPPVEGQFGSQLNSESSH